MALSSARVLSVTVCSLFSTLHSALCTLHGDYCTETRNMYHRDPREYMQPTEMAFARFLGGTTSRHSRQSSINVENDKQPRWIGSVYCWLRELANRML